MEEFRLDGLVAWVTGAGRGLGRAIAAALADAGARVALTARDGRALDALGKEISDFGGQAFAAPGSVRSLQEMRRCADDILEMWGRLDILVNNAGISPVLAPTETLSEEIWQDVLDVNLSGAFRCARVAAGAMLDAGGGSIINISSVHGTAGLERLSAYAASKGGVQMLTRVLAAEWADRAIRVNAIAPGYLNTAMTEQLRANDYWRERVTRRIPLGRFGEPEQVAPAAVFLASPAASYITGSTLYVDGGWTAV